MATNFLKASKNSAVSPKDIQCTECGLYNADSVGVEETTEAKPNKGLKHGIRPSQKEVDEHERTHLPFRSWCAHCVRGKGQSHPHWNTAKEECGTPIISWDYFYMNDDENKANNEEDEESDDTPIVAWHDSNSKATMCYAVPNKGECEYAIIRGMTDVNEVLGYNKMIFKGDQEPALRTMMKRIKMMSGEQCVMEQSPVGESQSNGAIEGSIKIMQGQFRTMRADLETCYKRAIPRTHQCMAWLVRHVGGTMFRESLGTDGMTAYKRIKGREFTKEIIKFGECVWYMRPKSKGKAKAMPRWESGVWSGIRDESGEYIIGTEKGYIKVRTVRRKGSEEERWNWEEFDRTRGLPWEPTPGRPGIEMTSRIGGDENKRDVLPKNEPEEPKEIIQRAFRIAKADVLKHQITEGCAGCKKAITGGRAVNHSEKCRSRFQEIFMNSGDPRLLRQASRMNVGREEETRESREIPTESRRRDEGTGR